MTTAPRVYYAMARDGAAPAWAGAVGAKSGAPLGAVLVQATLAALLVVIGTFDGIVAVLRVRDRRLPRADRRGARPDAPTGGGGLVRPSAAIFLACIAIVLLMLGAGRPQESALGLAVVALGWPAYRFLVKPEAARA